MLFFCCHNSCRVTRYGKRLSSLVFNSIFYFHIGFVECLAIVYNKLFVSGYFIMLFYYHECSYFVCKFILIKLLRFFNIYGKIELNILTHTLVVVRLVWRKGAIYRFFWWRCEGSLSEEKMDMAFRLDFFCYFFSSRKKM